MRTAALAALFHMGFATESPPGGTAGSAGTAGSVGTLPSAGSAGSTGTAGTVGTVGQVPWRVLSPAQLGVGVVPMWLDWSRDTGLVVPKGSWPSIVAQPGLVVVAGLDLQGQAIDTDAARILATATPLAGLQVLRLGHASIADGAVSSLLTAPGLPALVVLDLSGADADVVADIALADRAPHLRELDLRGTRAPTHDEARALGERLRSIEALWVDPDWPTSVLDALRTGLGDRASALQVE